MAYAYTGDRGLLIARGDGNLTAAVRTNDSHDVNALRDLVRPYWENKKPVIEEAGRRTTETVVGHSPEPSVAMPFEQLLTSVEMEEGPRRLVKQGLSILNIPVAIHAWKWRAAELSTAGWIPEDLLEILHAQAWDLADRGLRHVLPDVLDKYTRLRKVRQALHALEKYSRGLQQRQAAWADQLSRHQFWDACPILFFLVNLHHFVVFALAIFFFSIQFNPLLLGLRSFQISFLIDFVDSFLHQFFTNLFAGFSICGCRLDFGDSTISCNSCSIVYAMKGEGQASQFVLPFTSSSGPGIGGQSGGFDFRLGR